MPKITPFLWFNTEAETAARFYTSVFKNSKITAITRYSGANTEVASRPKGAVMTVAFRLDGQDFVALNGGPMFKFNEAVSFVVNCKSQAEVDKFWKKLSAGGKPGQCGWLKDKFGVSWQIVPAILPELLNPRNPAAAQRVIAALMPMTKLDIKKLKAAYNAKTKPG